MFNGVFVQSKSFFERVYGEALRAEIAARVMLLGDLIDPAHLATRQEDLKRADFVFTGWGAPDIHELLTHCPKVRVIFFAGGTASYMLSRELWDRGILCTSSYVANAVPVAEYTLAAILLGLKGGWRAIMETKLSHHYERRTDVPGCYQTTVGLISCGAIARELLRLLRPFEMRTLVYDPFTSDAEIRALGAEPAGLDDLFALADVVSLHAPELDETRGMIRKAHLAAMKPGATFINTARGSLVHEPDLFVVARQRPDLQFVLDVVHPEPPQAESPHFTLPNIILTPHIAGAMGGECRRMGRYMVEELERHLDGLPMRWVITPELARRSIHRPDFMRDTTALTAA